MRVAVRYFSKGGKTKLLAEAIAKAVDAPAKTTDEALTERVNILFLGASVYAGKPAPEVAEFIQKNAANIGKIVVFGTSAGGKSTHAAIRSISAGVGVGTTDMFFQCPGPFLFLNKNRPNEEDCNAAAEFAKKQLKLVGTT